MFITADLDLKLDKQSQIYRHRTISPHGTGGLRWFPFDPEIHFGKMGEVFVQIKKPQPFIFRTNATILKESTQTAVTMSLKFLLAPDLLRDFSKFLEKNGRES